MLGKLCGFKSTGGEYFEMHYLPLNHLHQCPSKTSSPVIWSDGDCFELPVVDASVVPPRAEGRLIQFFVSGCCLQYDVLSVESVQISEVGK